MATKEELEIDIAELDEILKNVKSGRVRQMLEDNRKMLKIRLDNLPASKESLSKPAKLQSNQEESDTMEVESGETKKEIQEQKSTALKYKPITQFAWDQDGYNGKHVFVYVTLNGVGSVKDNVTCEFTKDSFDLKVLNLDGVNYRLVKSPLNKEIQSDKCKFQVKKDRVVITLRKTDGEFGTDHWTDLVEKNKALKSVGKNKDDPSAGLMDLMKQMYDEGDDQMKKTIGEAMLKSRQQSAMGKGMDMDM